MIALLALRAVLSSAQIEPPKLVIVQVKVPFKQDDEDPNVSIAIEAADQFDDDGRVTAIVWSKTDPIFREVTEGKNIPSTEAKLDVILRTAAQFNWKYVLFVQARRNGGEIQGAARLFINGRESWRDPAGPSPADRARLDGLLKKKLISHKTYDETLAGYTYRPMSVINSARGEEDARRSLARTWVELLGQGPLKAYPPKPRLKPNELNPGQKDPPNPNPNPNPNLNPGPVKKAWREAYEKVVAEGRPGSAILFLREAVDVSPFDPELRAALANRLINEKRPELAAEVAEAACQLDPSQPKLWLLAAQVYRRLGQTQRAEAILSEAQVRSRDTAFGRELAVQLALAAGDWRRARETLDSAKEDASLDFWRGVLAFMLGKVAEGESWMGKAKFDLSQPDDIERYELAIESLEGFTEASGQELSNLYGRLVLDRVSAENRTLFERQSLLNASRIKFAELLPTPALHTKSHQMHGLALKLLAQSLADGRRYLGSGSEDDITDARINLGEAIRALREAKAQALEERKGG